MSNILDEILAELKKVNQNLEKLNYIGNNADDVPDIMATKDISNYLRVNVNKVYELLFHRKDFPSMKLGGRYIVPKNKFLDWLDKFNLKREKM